MKITWCRLPFGLLFAALVALAIGGPIEAHAQAALPDVVKPPPSINLGSTSFYDGFGRVKPGVTVLEYLRWSHNTEFNDANGNENPSFIAPRVDNFPLLSQFIVATKWRPFGGAAGFSVLVPVVDTQTSFAADSPKRLSADKFGLGDIIAGPTYQSKFFIHGSSLSRAGAPLLKGGASASQAEPGPYFAYRVQFLVQIPSGEFNPKISINPGSGYWAVAPYLAATYLPRRGFEMSTRLHYQYNLPTTKIANPPPIPHLVYLNGQAGQLVYGNFTGSYRSRGGSTWERTAMGYIN